MTKHHFRKAKISDIDAIWIILQQAILRRKKDGSDQWQDGYPNLEIIQKDIEKEAGFVLTEEKKILGYCAVMINDEPAYDKIQGKWLTNDDFVVFHRVAISEKYLGNHLSQKIIEHIENFAQNNTIFSLKVDTNFDNLAMMKILDKSGFTYCGEVYFRGSARRAYEKVLTKNQEIISPIIQVAELLQLYKSEDLVLIDVSTGKNAKSNYEEKHLEGALFVDLNTQLAEIEEDLSFGGRHPLPKIENFATTLANLGITTKSHVVLYDNANGANAAGRFWWMLKAVGHEKVQVLNGGFQEAEKLNFPSSSKTEIIQKTESYKVDHWKLPIAEMEEVERVSQKEDHIVIDVRDVERYNGKTEPIDLIAGHIPGAINVPLTQNLDANGLFLTPNELLIKYENIFGNVNSENRIVHCGSGVTACHTLLAIAYSGLEIPKLYVGSWSEWSRNNKTIATK